MPEHVASKCRKPHTVGVRADFRSGRASSEGIIALSQAWREQAWQTTFPASCTMFP